MRFENYILTEGRIKGISFDEVTKLLEGKHSDAYGRWKTDKKYIFRGTLTGNWDFAFGNSKAREKRKSHNTKNYSTLFFDNHPMWSKFPKRSESFVCSTDAVKAKGYGYGGGAVYNVFPENGTTIGVCPENDIFQSFSKTMHMGSVGSLNSFVGLVIDLVNTVNYSIGTSDDSYKVLVKKFKDIKKIWDTLDQQVIDDTYLTAPFLHDVNGDFDGDLFKLFEYIYNPQKNGFKIVKSGQKLPDNKEVWMGGNCLFINVNYVPEIGYEV